MKIKDLVPGTDYVVGNRYDVTEGRGTRVTYLEPVPVTKSARRSWQPAINTTLARVRYRGQKATADIESRTIVMPWAEFQTLLDAIHAREQKQDQLTDQADDLITRLKAQGISDAWVHSSHKGFPSIRISHNAFDALDSLLADVEAEGGGRPRKETP